MKTTANLYLLNYNSAKTYLTAGIFIAGNIILPQLVHLIPQGGLTWLPIYFFTLIGAYKYGWKVGLLTALLSPLINSVLFGMPATAMLPIITIKSTLLAFAAGMAARYFQRISLGILALVVLAYQIPGSLCEWIMTGSFFEALQDFRIGLPGMGLQIFGGYLFLLTQHNYAIRRENNSRRNKSSRQ
ncbi:ECF transporter S component [Odoribacter lunatus]|uniref:ECF transporter S component n=1 Tax=Odoribacter lunatus TaxID=2941335 RepID=UPI00203E680D|nr:ECF transporter S component [Odoribacter lunatus]